MFGFFKKPTKEKIRQYKTIRYSGMKFVIRKLNPFFDFSINQMPQIFSSFISRRKVDPESIANESTMRKAQEDMRVLICAGLVFPKVNLTTNKNKDLSIEDIMSDTNLALRLYTEILIHSLNMFKGLKGLFFSVKTRRLFYIEYRKSMEKHQQKC